jgi:hypothetical protein
MAPPAPSNARPKPLAWWATCSLKTSAAHGVIGGLPGRRHQGLRLLGLGIALGQRQLRF